MGYKYKINPISGSIERENDQAFIEMLYSTAIQELFKVKLKLYDTDHNGKTSLVYYAKSSSSKSAKAGSSGETVIRLISKNSYPYNILVDKDLKVMENGNFTPKVWYNLKELFKKSQKDSKDSFFKKKVLVPPTPEIIVQLKNVDDEKIITIRNKSTSAYFTSKGMYYANKMPKNTTLNKGDKLPALTLRLKADNTYIYFARKDNQEYEKIVDGPRNPNQKISVGSKNFCFKRKFDDNSGVFQFRDENNQEVQVIIPFQNIGTRPKEIPARSSQKQRSQSRLS